MLALLLRTEQQLGSWDAGSFRETLALSGVLHRVLLQSRQVDEALPAPHAFELGLPGVHALVLGQVLALLEAFVAVGALKRFLPGVDPSMTLQLRRVPEALFTVGTFQRLLSGRVAAVLDELGG